MKDEKSSKFGLRINTNIGFYIHGWLYFCDILLDFGLRTSILATFSLLGSGGGLGVDWA